MENFFIESERLVLKPLTLNELIDIANNNFKSPDFTIMESAITTEVISAINKKIEKMKNASEEYHEWYTYWLIIIKETRKGAGYIGFKGVPDEKGYVEVGYSISNEVRGNGFMTEALNLMIEWTLDFADCSGITATNVLNTNIGSIRVLEKCNFKLVEVFEETRNYVFDF